MLAWSYLKDSPHLASPPVYNWGAYQHGRDTMGVEWKERWAARDASDKQALALAEVDRAAGRVPQVRPAAIPALPQQARQLPASPWCLPTCSSALMKERETWRQMLIKAGEGEQPANRPILP